MSFEETIRAIVREEIERAMRGRQLSAVPAIPPEYLTVQEAANLAKVRPETVREWVNSGELPRHGAGKVMRVRRDQFEVFLATGSQNEDTEVDLDQRAREIVARHGENRRMAA